MATFTWQQGKLVIGISGPSNCQIAEWSDRPFLISSVPVTKMSPAPIYLDSLREGFHGDPQAEGFQPGDKAALEVSGDAFVEVVMAH